MQQVLHRQVYLYDISDRLGIFTPKSKSTGNNGSMLSDGQDISDTQIDSSMGNSTMRNEQPILKTSFQDTDDDLKKASQADKDQDQARAPEHMTQSMPMFIDDPIIANLPMKKQQKYFIEEAFRSQLKLISDTVAKEMIFILEFFDFKIAN